MGKTKVMIVDDSAVIRQVLTDVLTSDSSIEVIAAVVDPILAMKRMKEMWPDVIVLDIEMPRMDGLTFLKKIMEERPTPVVMCSTLTEKGAETTLQALSLGAVEIVTKPKIGLKRFLEEETAMIVSAVKAAAVSKLSRSRPAISRKGKIAVASATGTDGVSVVTPRSALAKTTQGVVAIGTSTGGTQALEIVLSELPRVSPGLVIVQHMPEKFTAAFASRLNDICEIEVIEAKNNDQVLPGRALIAPGGRHMSLKRSGARYFVEVYDGPVVSRHRPSVDVLFKSVARVAGKNALGIIMTGMGSDGATGIRDMNDKGAHTVAQDEESCVVYGMPKEAVKLGAISTISPLNAISEEIMAFGGQHG